MPTKTTDKRHEKPYYPISRYYKDTFGQRVHKISVSVAYTCPNRILNAGQGCIFCDEWGSAGNPQTSSLPLADQISISRSKLRKRFRINKFLVYFQAFTNTFTDLDSLEQNLTQALSETDIRGVIIGTRPDCLPEKTIDLIGRFGQDHFISVELGLQSFFDSQLIFLQRGHTVEQSRQAIDQLDRKTTVNIGCHLIFGIPGENDQTIVQTAEEINALPITDVKLHNLHVLRNTPLHRLYREGKFQPIDLAEYSRRVILFLEHLAPDRPVQRLAAYMGDRNNLIAPDWTGERTRPSQVIQDRMNAQNTYQGRLALGWNGINGYRVNGF